MPLDITSTLSKLKLPTGLVGRASYIVFAIVASIASIGIAIRTEMIGYACLVAIVGLVFYIVKRLFDYADKHPQLTVLDGQDFLSYTQITVAQKGVRDIPAIDTELPEPLSLPSEQPTLQLPDAKPAGKKRGRRTVDA